MHLMLKCLIVMLALWPGVFRVVESKLVHSLRSATEVQFLMWACSHFICVFSILFYLSAQSHSEACNRSANQLEVGWILIGLSPRRLRFELCARQRAATTVFR